MGKKRLRMFAGPNGSGKSDLIKELDKKDISLGPFVNADRIAKQLHDSGYLDLQDYKLKKVTQSFWERAIANNQELVSRIQRIEQIPEVVIKRNTLVCKSEQLNSYVSALIADFLRYMLVEQEISFSFETVMSHQTKIEFLEYVKKKGYTAYLYFIATESPEINIARVQNRVAKGGHDVPKEKIRDRYFKSLDLLLNALRSADRAYLIDNSKKNNFVILEKKYNGMGYPQVEKMPNWVIEYVVKKLESEN